MKILTAAADDALVILELQRCAYRIEAALYGDYNIPPLTQSLDEIRDQFEDHTFLKAINTHELVGSVRAIQDRGTCYIGRLIVKPELHNQGIGSLLMEQIEARFPDAPRYELFTGRKSEKNIYLYEKLGYRKYKQVELSQKVELVYMEKVS
ncbi:GNAT family N-acetyltransferase [Chloroflexota bacterium]